MGVCHYENPAVNIVGEEVGNETSLVSHEPPFGHDVGGKLGSYPVPVLKAKGAEPLNFRGVICTKIQLLRLDCAEMREMTCSAGERVHPDLKPLGGGIEALAGMEKGALRFEDLKMDGRRHNALPSCF